MLERAGDLTRALSHALRNRETTAPPSSQRCPGVGSESWEEASQGERLTDAEACLLVYSGKLRCSGVPGLQGKLWVVMESWLWSLRGPYRLGFPGRKWDQGMV